MTAATAIAVFVNSDGSAYPAIIAREYVAAEGGQVADVVVFDGAGQSGSRVVEACPYRPLMDGVENERLSWHWPSPASLNLAS